MEKQILGSEQSYTLCEDSELSSEYEFITTPTESVYEEKDLPYRTKSPGLAPGMQIGIHEAPEKDGILLSISSPPEPARDQQTQKLKHVPCDIVLTVDVSGSMSVEAPPPVADPANVEHNGFSVLDLVKHAARTILETLDDTDRLAIVTFSTNAKVIQKLLPMTKENKALALANINKLQPESMTNLWHGILESIKVFEGDERSNCVPAIMILTDGIPNHLCPIQGYVRKLRSYKLPAALHTFGFGFSLRSGLLKSIAETGGGNYAFIPDSGMLGTVFIHAVANLQSTFATRVSVTLTSPPELSLVETIGGYTNDEGSVSEEVAFEEYFPKFSRQQKSSSRKQSTASTLRLELDSLQYGQSRNIFLKYKHRPLSSDAPPININITGRPVDGSLLDITVEREAQTYGITAANFAYHRARAEVCDLLGSIFPPNSLEERQVTSEVSLDELCAKVECLASRISNSGFKDASNLSLFDDLVGKDPGGQIRLALSTNTYFERWGKHYLLSILNAHQKQICNSFKDNGPLQYGRNSPLFTLCRDALDLAFDNLPPPTPSRPPKSKAGQTQSRLVNMRRYHDRDSPCFAGECRATLSNGKQLAVKALRRNMEVMTQTGKAVVCAVVATKVQATPLCVLGDLRITPWHPVCIEGAWNFPAHIAQRSELYDGYIYSILLERNGTPGAHTIQIEGQWATTLGHGIITEQMDVRSHQFFGNYNAVVSSLDKLPVMEGILACAGIKRDSAKGLACGFEPLLNREETTERRRESQVAIEVA